MRGKQQLHKRGLHIALLALLTLVWSQAAHAPVIAQTKPKPRVLIHNQSIVAGQIMVAEVVTPQAAWIVIHRDQQGNLGAAIGVGRVARRC